MEISSISSVSSRRTRIDSGEDCGALLSNSSIVFHAADSRKPLMVPVPVWITTFSDLAAFNVVMSLRTFPQVPDVVLDKAAATYHYDPESVAMSAIPVLC